MLKAYKAFHKILAASIVQVIPIISPYLHWSQDKVLTRFLLLTDRDDGVLLGRGHCAACVLPIYFNSVAKASLHVRYMKGFALFCAMNEQLNICDMLCAQERTNHFRPKVYKMGC